MKETAESYARSTFKDDGVTVPTYFNDSKR